MFTKEESLRYARHISIPEVGTDGQAKLKNAKVLCVGAGGLGAPLSMYLAAAGIGTLGLVDFDAVDATNLQRQIIYGSSDVGKPKLEAAKNRLSEINPLVSIRLHETRLTSKNALEIFKEYDIIADGTDNFPARYLVNDACALTGKPNVHGSVFRFEGQVAVFDAKRGPCYRCVFPEPPPPGVVPSCAEGGVLGVLPGIVGTLQALETIKLILNLGEPAIGRLVRFDGLKMKFRELILKKDPACPLCGTDPSVKGLIDYDRFCGAKSGSAAEREDNKIEIEVEELKRLLDQNREVFILDVREPWEWEICRLPKSELIPLKELPNRLGDLQKDKPMIVHCKAGGRSARAVDFLRKSGFPKAKNLKGGIDAWISRIDPNLAKY